MESNVLHTKICESELNTMVVLVIKATSSKTDNRNYLRYKGIKCLHLNGNKRIKNSILQTMLYNKIRFILFAQS